MAVRCPQCNATVSDDDAVCRNCGFRLKAVEQPVQTQAPAAAPSDVKITIPPWATTEWGDPTVAALITVAIGIFLQYLVGLLLVAGALISDIHDISLGTLARIPPVVWLAFNLGTHGTTVILTGIIWLRLSARRSAKVVRRRIDVDRSKVFERAVKFAVVYAVVELAIALAMNNASAFTPGVVGGTFAPGPGADPVAAFFFGLLIGFVLGIYLHTACAGKRLRDVWPIRFEMQIPGSVGAAWRGAIVAFKIAIPSMAIFLYLAAILSAFSHGGGRGAASLIFTLLAVGIFWNGVDIGLLGLIAAMQLFLNSRGVSFVFFPLGSQNWIYAGIAIPLVALFVAGRRVGRDESIVSPAEAAKRGALVAVPVAIVCFLFAAINSSGFGGAYLFRALAVPLLWGVVSAAGAFFEASQRAQQSPAAQ